VATSAFVIQREGEKAGSGIKKLILFLVLFLAGILVLEVLFQTLIAPKMLIKNIAIESELALSDAEIRNIAGLSGKEYYFSFDVAEVQKRFDSIPLVRTAHVEKIFPDTIRIVLAGRKPLMLTFVDLNGKSIPVVLDDEGVIFQIGNSITEWNLPLLSGLRIENVRLGMKLPRILSSLLRSVNSIRTSAPELMALISELQVVKRDDIEFDVLLYPIYNSIRIRTGPEVSEDLIKQIFLVIDVIQKEGLPRENLELDFRSRRVTYRTKEG